jgi:hypothetical protein
MVLVLIAAAAFGEEAQVLGEQTLRFTLAPSFGFQVQEWDWEGVDTGKVMVFSVGPGVEYGIANWLDLRLLWLPGVNAWSQMENGGAYGIFQDMTLGLKAGIIGQHALTASEQHLLSAAAGIKLPFPSAKDSLREGDQHLWGTVIQVYYDFIATPIFTFNVFAEGIVYPSQYADTPNYAPRTVKHPVDLRFELEPRFQYPIEKAGINLLWGIPLAFSVSPVLNSNDNDAAAVACSFNPGAWFGVGFTRTPVPIEVTAHYAAALVGINAEPLHRVSLIGRVTIPLKK